MSLEEDTLLSEIEAKAATDPHLLKMKAVIRLHVPNEETATLTCELLDHAFGIGYTRGGVDSANKFGQLLNIVL